MTTSGCRSDRLNNIPSPPNLTGLILTVVHDLLSDKDFIDFIAQLSLPFPWGLSKVRNNNRKTEQLRETFQEHLLFLFRKYVC